MNEIEQVLNDHAARYPLMRPCDAVKLIYQNEFGGGHLVYDKQSAMAYLRHEYTLLAQSASTPLYEDIGNGMARLQLCALESSGMSLQAAFERFYQSSMCVNGTLESFLAKLNVSSELAKRGSLPFAWDELEAYLKKYSALGYPMVSHSEEYREAYRPAYRVIKK